MQFEEVPRLGRDFFFHPHHKLSASCVFFCVWPCFFTLALLYEWSSCSAKCILYCLYASVIMLRRESAKNVSRKIKNGTVCFSCFACSALWLFCFVCSWCGWFRADPLDDPLAVYVSHKMDVCKFGGSVCPHHTGSDRLTEVYSLMFYLLAILTLLPTWLL